MLKETFGKLVTYSESISPGGFACKMMMVPNNQPNWQTPEGNSRGEIAQNRTSMCQSEIHPARLCVYSGSALLLTIEPGTVILVINPAGTLIIQRAVPDSARVPPASLLCLLCDHQPPVTQDWGGLVHCRSTVPKVSGLTYIRSYGRFRRKRQLGYISVCGNRPGFL